MILILVVYYNPQESDCEIILLFNLDINVVSDHGIRTVMRIAFLKCEMFKKIILFNAYCSEQVKS